VNRLQLDVKVAKTPIGSPPPDLACTLSTQSRCSHHDPIA